MSDTDHNNLRIGFAGTPDFAASILAQLVAAGMAPMVVYTRPDKGSGRGRKTTPSPVKREALQHQLALEQPASLKPAAQHQQLASYDLDLLVVAAYGLILPKAVLATPRLGCLNVHASLLPRWRGAAPVERAMLAGDTRTGICLMGMEAGLDTGPVFASRQIAITQHTLGQQLEMDLADLGGGALVEFLSQPKSQLQQALNTGQPQDHELATYAHKLTPSDALLDWQQPATQLHRQVRALAGRLPAVAQQGDLRVQVLATEVIEGVAAKLGDKPCDNLPAGTPGQVVQATKKGIAVATGSGTLVLTLVKLNRGKGNPLTPADLVNGYREHFEVNAHFDPIPIAGDS